VDSAIDPRPEEVFMNPIRIMFGLFVVVSLCTIAAGDPPLLQEEIEFQKASGDEAFRLDPESDTAELQLAGGKRLATYERVGKNKLRFILKRGEVGGTIEPNKARDRYTLRGPDGKKIERILIREPDGDWQMTDAKEKVIVELKLRDFGFKVVDARDREIGRIKVKGDKISLRDGAKKEILTTKDTKNTLLAACFQLEGLTLPTKGAFAMAVITWPPSKLEEQKE
jgi:hypothetical protein